MTQLTPDRILDEAMALLAANGEAALSMRPLATRLDVTPMALYRYFRDRDALLVALVARVSEGIEVPRRTSAPADHAADHAVEIALTLHELLVTHPWMIRLISTGRLASPAGLEFSEALLGCARDCGLDTQASFVFYRTMFAAILGQATISHAKTQHEGSAISEHALASAPPLVASLAPEWAHLDAAATPTAVFHAIAAQLPQR
ncbi:TetR/AcrR family transcriptional regulator [Leucobacter albus]|uniref:TetR/AcrR family transcriptional regulator n=1 Tax=Leucobacter albus TaxID=272210 RepID=A0ABW3TT42_9MICO